MEIAFDNEKYLKIQKEKIASIYTFVGKKTSNVETLSYGDIGATVKLSNTNVNDTLSPNGDVKYAKIEFPTPYYCQAIMPKAKGDEDKISAGISKILEEDYTLKYENNAETAQQLIYGMGDMHISVIEAKLKSRFGVSVKLDLPKIAYREMITKRVQVQGKHKKQSGGAGQYGDVHIRFSPSEQEFEFSEELFGGSVPKNYVPAVEKGLLECMAKGPLAGCRVVNIKAVLYDGSYHDVDSNEMAFKIAASLAFKKGIVEARPCLLEPIMKLEITVPESFVGAVMGDMPNRRGMVLGMDSSSRGTVLHAEAPQAELFDYAIALRSMTQARGSFTVEFARYAELPGNLADKVIAAYKKEQEEK